MAPSRCVFRGRTPKPEPDLETFARTDDRFWGAVGAFNASVFEYKFAEIAGIDYHNQICSDGTSEVSVVGGRPQSIFR